MERLPDLPAAEPQIRIGIAIDSPAVELTAALPFRIVGVVGQELARGDANEVWRFTADGAGRLQAVGPAGRRIGPVDAAVAVRPARDGPVRIAGLPYHGEALVYATGPGRVTAANVVGLERYLLGVVPAEIPSLEYEAVKAQAVAARTYAVRNLGRREQFGFDLFATVADQVYAGVEREDPMATRAVQETRGEILAYGGRPVRAFYHSTCGGHTAGIDEVWGEDPVPYLQGVSDAMPGTDRYYCDASTRFRWEERWSSGELRRILSDALTARYGRRIELDRIDAVEVTGRTRTNRAETLRIQADGQRFEVMRDSIRWVLRPEPGRGLNSTLFTLSRAPADGVALAAGGRGWGHGIGMCQMGAIGRARAGQDHHSILTSYYQGARVVRIY